MRSREKIERALTQDLGETTGSITVELLLDIRETLINKQDPDISDILKEMIEAEQISDIQDKLAKIIELLGERT